MTPVPGRLRQRFGSVGAATCSMLLCLAAPAPTGVAAGGGLDPLLGARPSTDQD
ncbi:hypothetical protein PU560_17195 [Georgenia sp. 10Sc9-8]|uniref:Uncharacterized protein n=1 Tax=Georgenia halotolerans TaxID=3028317 RepID=A0ABT5U1H4_9MICO|nr:hypothetical protein [Georgenia halotolerans]